MSSSHCFRLRPLTDADATALRRAGGPACVAATNPGYPCRQCLRDAEVGDELILVSHDPFEVDSPYRSASPIFIHRYDCATDRDRSALPEQLTCRQLSVRAFDSGAFMTDAAVVDGRNLGSTLESFFADPVVSTVHVHNASRGCWAVTVEREL